MQVRAIHKDPATLPGARVTEQSFRRDGAQHGLSDLTSARRDHTQQHPPDPARPVYDLYRQIWRPVQDLLSEV